MESRQKRVMMLDPGFRTIEGRGEFPDAARFSYSSPDLPLLQQAVIRAVELAGGQRRLKQLYDDQRRGRLEGESFFDAAIRFLALEVRFDQEALRAVPASGPVVFVANHPYGVLDGIVLAALALRVRPETKILANDVLYRVPETRAHLLPVAFGETRQSLAINVASRRAAQAWLAEGGAIGIFPGGGVATSERVFSRPVYDLPWHPFTAKLVSAARATVVPIHFHGQNSRLFQIASHLSLTLRLSLLFRETTRRIGTRVDVTIGEPVAFEALEAYRDKAALTGELRRRTYALAPTAEFDWMRQGRIRGSSRFRRKQAST
ncbi:lysophospholipid acyltransferase family protein [Microbaculum marinum]|uniref:Lysophospholipid acyltransferase family protein n=1 Tax=Microbaculum marinum TaxID=1764581 RepID=A0AAW9RSE6_9HYPH